MGFLRCFSWMRAACTTAFVRAYVAILVHWKWWLLKPYYEGLLVQARFLYRQHFWFKERRQVLGLAYAEEAFVQDAEHFFRLAKKEPWEIRLRIFWDATRGRAPRPYYIGSP